MGISLNATTRDCVKATCSFVYALVILAFSLGIATTPALAKALDLERVVDFRIPRQPIDTALLEFSSQAHIQVLISPNVHSNGQVGELNATTSARNALDLLLRNTGLRYSAIGESIRITSQVGGGPTSFSDGRDSSANATTSQTTPSQQLDEVIVTAQKRSERLQDVPVPVTAINGDALVEQNQPRIQDYYTSVPGLSLSPSPGSFGQQQIVVRGITTGAFTSPTVGIAVDGVPFGTAVGFAGDVVPDIDPNDLARIEVLRGPQGTLFGASSMGGLVNFVTVDPSTQGISGRLEAGTDSVYNGAALGYSFRGAVNLPVGDSVAVRASAFTRENPGYIDNPVLSRDGVNVERVSGGRLAALWLISDAFRLKLSALYQNDRADGSNEVDLPVNGYSGPTLSGLKQFYPANPGEYERKTQAYSALLDGKIGKADLTFLSGYNVNNFSNVGDASWEGFNAASNFYFGAPETILVSSGYVEKFSQEARLNIPITSRIEWLVSGFYTHEFSNTPQAIYAYSAGRVSGDLFSVLSGGGGVYEEYAGFTDLTFHFTDQFSIQIGGRESEIHQRFESGTSTGAFLGFTDVTSPGLPSSNDSAFTYLITPQYKLSPDVMVYGRFASGYRPGGSNGPQTLQMFYNPAIPADFSPDKTQDYELGIKGDFLNHALTLDASVYYIDWKSIQLTIENTVGGCSCDYTANGARAKSEGTELSLTAKPLSGLTIQLWGTWDDAVLTEDLPPNTTVTGYSGDRLPFSTKFSGNFSAQQNFPITERTQGYVGATVSYVGDRKGTFVSAPTVRQDFPSYTKTDARLGLTYKDWNASLYINNLTDERGILGGGAGTYPPFAFVYIQPRTVGLSVSRRF